MLRVLLVDDEEAVTQSLQYGIKWDSLGLCVTSVAKSGMQALRYIEHHPVDIVITDIRMADMDGLSLSQHISATYQNIQVIIISGFAEFSYAQKALSYGVAGYCLKPIEYSELTRYLQLAIRRLKGDHSADSSDDLLDALHQGNESATRKCLEELGFDAGAYYVAASVSRQPLFSGDPKILTIKIGHKRYSYFSPVPFKQNDVHTAIAQPECIGLSYSTHPASIKNLGAVLKKQSYAAFQFFFEPDRKQFTGIAENKHPIQISEFSKCLAAKDLDRIIAMLHSIQQSTPDTLSVSYAWHLYNAIAGDNTYGPCVGVDDIYSPEHLVFHFGTFKCMIDTICTRLQESIPSAIHENMSNTAFLYMMKYIDTHLSEGFSLQQLAKELNMNANYLGQVFKRETGKTYTAYVTELRIERAKEMLRMDESSISDIAASLGFNDYFYFLKTFKRITGLTPKQFRQNPGGDCFLSDFS